MAFVDITTPKSPVAVAVPLLQCHAGKRAFTPEVCQEVLQSTNFAKNIRDMLTMISELPTEKQAAFKEVVLATFDRREQPNDIVVLGKKLAAAGGYETEFNNVDKIGDITGEYLLSGVGRRAGITVFCLGQYDVSQYEEVFLQGREISLMHSNLSKIKKLRFANRAIVDSRYVSLPANLDVSMCDKVNLSDCDLSGVKGLCFKDGATVFLQRSTNLPENLDVSMCRYVDLAECDLTSVRNLRFQENATVSLCGVKNLPEDLDVSMCQEVYLAGCDLSPVKNLCFKKGAYVALSEVQNLPEDLDVSMCGGVDLYECDLSAVKNLRFDSQLQKGNSHAKIPKTVKVTYSEDEDASLGKMLRDRGGR